jgi:hypothetical protein
VEHQARLDRRLFPSRLDRIRQPGEAVAFHPSRRSEGRIQDDQHVADTPGLARSAQTPAQNFAPPLAWIQISSTCLTPSMSTPTAMWADLLITCDPSRTLTTSASR